MKLKSNGPMSVARERAGEKTTGIATAGHLTARNVTAGDMMAELRQPNDAIGRRLREMFSAIEDQAIPEKFLDLLEKLDAAERAAEAPIDGNVGGKLEKAKTGEH